ncbi:geranylgeranyl transferase type-2 subunit alpha 1-like isoform X1 [Olea europaea var. sylvestris]|uniref:geranylgeranyl transferase type-2 subunit alpha 1-like isoform X1 n=1 Tax=Olea europaea var. sylvestris TaxID=158386 RepID=UPI000C1D2717|nr:geranylgeranyl transferase type-2 subunit alpha 1-like isoform X1 [Olea europaea var. sylvestris]XP_022872973.1 geranylgeranyl transferase type-2 subunit alpha 1-like isoform X1 [Olea europaea var. sylvestris]XP_022872974.1 geranylgeranyl transferase type-2 subunit alpha 1-like isoform X1 [Olea europaea var. sylvestris]
MHGIYRKTPSQEEQEASALKAIELRDLQSQFLHLHHNKIYTKEALETSAKLLEVNPEHYTGWNYRKLAVQHFLNHQSETEADSESIQSVLNEELKVVENALKKNFKSYGAWYHRKWVLSKGHSSTDNELRLLGKFQKLDSRNFNAWNYRRFITMLKKISDEEELQYTTDMIYDNFSNYSAWHNRSVLLSHLFKKRGERQSHKESVLEEEFEFVRNALFTDPDDQSGWFYHLWLLDQTVKLEPFLLSSWPPHGSSRSVDYLDGCNLFPSMHSQSKDRMFPLVLYFSEPVEGVNSSTVTIECEYYANEDVIWRPLSANKFGFAQVWLTYLNLPDEVHSLKDCHLKVFVAQFPGIVSSSGFSCSQTSHIVFSLCVPSHDREHAEGQTVPRFSWKDKEFYSHATQSHDASLLRSLHQLKIAEESKSKAASDWSMKIISNEIAHCRELLSSTNCKIGKLTLARLLMAQNKLISYGIPNDGIEVHYEEILGLYHDLMKLDPVHICYYEDESSLVLLKQVTSSMESILRYCYQYGDSTSPRMYSCLCLRLNGLLLSQIGSVERLLWIQILDLSHNKIRSIEGLEALQLLSCLNLSNNKICSFTALDPLRSLKSLKVLNISYNEIGAHAVNTRRYLCSSPMTHTVENDWNFKEFTNSGVKLNNHWDVFFIFRDLNLIQLDIMGNAVVNDQLKSFLFKLMPSLKWLDGENRN